MVDPAIELRNATKIFPGGMVGLAGLDLGVPAGAVYGLIGRNGGGKTTALRVLMGLLRADSGSAHVLGWDLWSAPRQIRAKIAYVSQTQQVHGWMKLSELCRYTAHFYDRWDMAYAETLARRWGLPWDRAVGAFSSGQQRKAAMLLAFASRPQVLLLDEPVANLDPIARREIMDEIITAIAQGEGCTVLFSTHLLGDLERVAEYVGIMDRGRLAMTDRLESWQTTLKRVQVIFPSSGVPCEFAIPGSLQTRVCGPVITAIVRLTGDLQLEPLRSIPGARVNVFSIGLEELFIELFGDKKPQPDSSQSEETTSDHDEASGKILSINQACN